MEVLNLHANFRVSQLNYFVKQKPYEYYDENVDIFGVFGSTFDFCVVISM